MQRQGDLLQAAAAAAADAVDWGLICNISSAPKCDAAAARAARFRQQTHATIISEMKRKSEKWMSSS